MNIDLFIENLQKPLPGLEIQMLMAPPVRSFDDKVPSNVRKGGVCILLFKKNEIWNFVLIKRTEDGGTHSGQISLPGGKFEEEDYSITYTSVREMEEEIGVAKSDIKILGLLTELYIPPSNFLVTPIVALLQNPPNFIASPEEVSEILEINIDDILDQTVVQSFSKIIDVSSLPNGVYFVHIITEKYETNRKIIINH